MNPLVKKEIRLLFPAWVVAMLLALVQAITRSYDFYVATLLFFGLTILALSSIGRETSLNTFSSLLSQPEERLRIWTVKLSVLAGAFLSVFLVWLAAFGIAFLNADLGDYARKSSYDLFFTVCLIATATFTGGLWSTLLLRQLAGAFWLTLLVPAVLSGIAGALLANSDSDSAVIAVLAVIFAIYSVGGFFFARWLFFNAQDVGWTGGTLVLPEWRFAASKNSDLIRRWKPVAASFKKELQLHQVSLLGAAGLLVAHIGILVWRNHHQYQRDSAGEILTSIFWMIWLVLPVVIGATAIAEERKLGVMESQLCLPISRWRQFAFKGFLVIVLGILFGGVIPMFLEHIAIGLAPHKTQFSESEFHSLPVTITGLAAWLALVSYFASSLAKSFLQAVGCALATLFGCTLSISLFTNNRMVFFDSISQHSLLPFFIGIPTLIVTLFWLAYSNFKNFRDGWPLWRRNLLGLVSALIFITVTSSALYHRVWEIFEPAEPPHGPARMSLANPPVIYAHRYDNDILVQLPDGRFWFNQIGYHPVKNPFIQSICAVISPFPTSVGPQQSIAGSNWVSTVVRHVESWSRDEKIHVSGYLETVGVKSDGTLWTAGNSGSTNWDGDHLSQLGDESDWRAVSWSSWGPSVYLLKKDGTLWYWGTNSHDWFTNSTSWPRLRDFTPRQFGTDSDWQQISPDDGFLQKTDGTVWSISRGVKPPGNEIIQRETSWDPVEFQKIPDDFNLEHDAYVRKDGTLWLCFEAHSSDARVPVDQTIQFGDETNWVLAVPNSWEGTMALKSDGTLWSWYGSQVAEWKLGLSTSPVRLGIHNDWVAMAKTASGVVALAADGSLWLWPPRDPFNFYNALLKLPKQPQYLGNVFGFQTKF